MWLAPKNADGAKLIVCLRDYAKDKLTKKSRVDDLRYDNGDGIDFRYRCGFCKKIGELKEFRTIYINDGTTKDGVLACIDSCLTRCPKAVFNNPTA